jgi:hypothetical protein
VLLQDRGDARRRIVIANKYVEHSHERDNLINLTGAQDNVPDVFVIVSS